MHLARPQSQQECEWKPAVSAVFGGAGAKAPDPRRSFSNDSWLLDWPGPLMESTKTALLTFVWVLEGNEPIRAVA